MESDPIVPWSQNALARATGVPPRRINEIVLQKRGITADTALRLAAAFRRSPVQPDLIGDALDGDFRQQFFHGRILGRFGLCGDGWGGVADHGFSCPIR